MHMGVNDDNWLVGRFGRNAMIGYCEGMRRTDRFL